MDTIVPLVRNRIGIQLEDIPLQVPAATGSPDHPLAPQEVEEKFRRCAGFGQCPLSEGRTEKILHFVENLENQKELVSRLQLFA
jgi:hypothetical protein